MKKILIIALLALISTNIIKAQVVEPTLLPSHSFNLDLQYMPLEVKWVYSGLNRTQRSIAINLGDVLIRDWSATNKWYNFEEWYNNYASFEIKGTRDASVTALFTATSEDNICDVQAWCREIQENDSDPENGSWLTRWWDATPPISTVTVLTKTIYPSYTCGNAMVAGGIKQIKFNSLPTNGSYYELYLNCAVTYN